MAIVIYGQSECPLWDGVIVAGDGLVVTSAFIEDAGSSLWRYSDAAMHRACFTAWELRREFVEQFNEFWNCHYRGVRFMHDDGRVEERQPRS